MPPTGVLAEKLPKRFTDKVSVNPSTGCWDWVAAKGPRGAGAFSFKGKNARAYRVAYELIFGIPSGRDVHHLCLNPGCVNPMHLADVTEQEHYIMDHPAKNRPFTYCKRGHEMTRSNTYLAYNADGSLKQRMCKSCREERGKIEAKLRWQSILAKRVQQKEVELCH